jgi:hypothetical protein
MVDYVVDYDDDYDDDLLMVTNSYMKNGDEIDGVSMYEKC